MSLESPQHKGSSTWKIIALIFIVAPLAVVTCGLILMAVIMGVGALVGTGNAAVGVMLLGLAGLAGWYLYSLMGSLWFNRRGASIILGLIVGLIILSIGVFNIADDAFDRIRSNNTWIAKNYVETYGLGLVFLTGWGLTLFLILRAMYWTPIVVMTKQRTQKIIGTAPPRPNKPWRTNRP
jgi:hypothetical protein